MVIISEPLRTKLDTGSLGSLSALKMGIWSKGMSFGRSSRCLTMDIGLVMIPTWWAIATAVREKSPIKMNSGFVVKGLGK